MVFFPDVRIDRDSLLKSNLYLSKESELLLGSDLVLAGLVKSLIGQALVIAFPKISIQGFVACFHEFHCHPGSACGSIYSYPCSIVQGIHINKGMIRDVRFLRVFIRVRRGSLRQYFHRLLWRLSMWAKNKRQKPPEACQSQKILR